MNKIIIMVLLSFFTKVAFALNQENAIILNHDLSFNIPVLKYLGPDDMAHFYNANFIFRPKDNRLLFEVNSVTEISQTSAANFESEETVYGIGNKIYERAFGRGCEACHIIASNPQLRRLIQAGELDIDSFAEVLINGRNGMPKAMEAIMAVGPVKNAGYTEEQAINAVYKYLGGDVDLGIFQEDAENILISQEDEGNAIILNSELGFNIPAVKYLDSKGIGHFYNVDFVFAPSDNKLLFEAVKVTEENFQRK